MLIDELYRLTAANLVDAWLDQSMSSLYFPKLSLLRIGMMAAAVSGLCYVRTRNKIRACFAECA